MKARQYGAIVFGVLAFTSLVIAGQTAPQTPPPSPPPASQQPSEVAMTITGDPGTPPRLAVPDLLPLSSDGETVAASRTIGQVLWNDLGFEREFYLIPRDTYSSIPLGRSAEDIPFDRWRELGADGLITGTIRRDASGVLVQLRLWDVRSRRQAFAREYSGSVANPRMYAHTFSDEIHQSQRALRGVARTKLTFSSDRDGQRAFSPADSNREVKEIYIADYDGENQKRVTINRTMNITPVWSPDGKAIAYTSYRTGEPDIYISFIYQAVMERPLEKKLQNWLPSWSPDGSRLAFTSNRDGNPELYVVDRNGSNVRRLTQHPAIDTTPTWSPTGTQIAFTSDRSGSPQIWTIGADGLNLKRLTYEGYCDRPTWSPAPFNEVAYVTRSGPGHDIKILDLAKNESRQITFGEGTNESPSYAPNGRHLAFASTRAGKWQIFTIARDGQGLRQITKAGNNRFPDWSK